MGGEGSIQHMINSLRNNRNLLRKKSIFKKERTFLSTKKEYYKAAQEGEVELKKATKEELILLREKIIKQRKIESIRSWVIVLIVMTPLILLGINASYNTSKEEIQHLETENENYLIEHINDYTYYLEEGDKWIEKKNWNNATYRYEQAVKLFPDEYEANYRLALSYCYSCSYKNKNCEKGRTLTNQLLKSYPEDSKLLELKTIFDKQ